MRVVEQVPRENGIKRRWLKRKKVAKGPMAETALAAEGSKEVGRIEKPASAAREPEEARRPEEVGGLKEVEEPEGAGEVGELVPATRGPEEARGPEEVELVVRGPEELRRLGELAPAARKSEEAGGPEEIRRSREPATTVSSS